MLHIITASGPSRKMSIVAVSASDSPSPVKWDDGV